MLRTLQVCERNILISPPAVVNLTANTPKTVIPVQVPQPTGELAQRLIQAIGGDIYVSFGVGLNDSDEGVAGTVDNVNNFHCFIANGQQRDISNDRQRVVAFTTGSGVRVAVELRWRVNSVQGVQTQVGV